VKQRFLIQSTRVIPVLLAVVGFSACATAGGVPRPSPPDPLSRIEILARILALEDSRSLGGGAIQSFLQHEDPAVRRRATVAAGRIGDRLILPELSGRLRDAEVEVRRAAAFSLGLIGAGESKTALIEALGDPDPLTRGRSSEALSRIPDSSAGTAIAAAFRKALPAGSASTLRIRGDDPGSELDPWVELRLHLIALARLKDAKAFKSAVLGQDGAPLVDWWASVWAAMRIADAELAPILTAGAAAEDPFIRSLAVRGLGALKSQAHLPLILRAAADRDPAVVRQALRALSAIGVPEASPGVIPHLDSPNLMLRREALLAIAALPRDSRARVRIIDNVGHSDPWIRSAAWPALIKIDAEDVAIVLSTIGADSDWRVRQAVAGALADTLGERAAALLLPMLKDQDTRVVADVLGALVRARGLDAIPTLLDYVSHQDPLLRTAAVEGLSAVEKLSDRRFVEAFAQAFDAALLNGDIETRIAAVDALAKSGNENGKGVLRRIAASDPARVVRQRALVALGEGGFASPEETAIRATDARRLVSIYEPGAELRYSPHVLISTRYGKIVMVLDLVDAPLTSLSFVRLAHAGFFNGLTFHRVVPGFVVQGGDPSGGGAGGPGLTVRCEYSGRPYGRGSVGMALSGKDTGSSQFFIAFEPQPHLDGVYTQFGRVVEGMDVVEKIRPGDVIERIEVFDGREGR
jgi:cyclophilin family peptidyl-prolyl cis-trans isomerase/HEAT repeat protein